MLLPLRELPLWIAAAGSPGAWGRPAREVFGQVFEARPSFQFTLLAFRRIRLSFPRGYQLPKARTNVVAVSYTHLRAHETVLDLVCRLLLEKKKTTDSLTCTCSPTQTLIDIQSKTYT